MYVINEEGYLVHFGVLGMRWGVRKERESINRKASPVDRSSFSKNASGQALQKQDIKVLSKGDTVHHVTVDANLRPRAGGLYVSYTEKDAQNYREEYKEFLEVTRDAKKVFEYDMKVVSDIITPSKEKKISAFVELAKDKKSGEIIESLGKNKMQSSWLLGIAKYLGYDKSSEVTKKYRELIDSDDPKKQQRAFDDFAQFLVWEPKIRKQYFQKLAKDGFTAMYDDFDMKTGYSKEPLIIFDPSKSLKIEKKKEV